MEDAEADRDISPEDLEDIRREANIMKANIQVMKDKTREFVTAVLPGATKQIVEFVTRNAANRLIKDLVKLNLTTIIAKFEDDGSHKKQAAVVDAIIELGNLVQKWGYNLSDWATKHKDDKITLEGVVVPLVDILHKYLTSINQVSLCKLQKATLRHFLKEMSRMLLEDPDVCLWGKNQSEIM